MCQRGEECAPRSFIFFQSVSFCRSSAEESLQCLFQNGDNCFDRSDPDSSFARRSKKRCAARHEPANVTNKSSSPSLTPLRNDACERVSRVGGGDSLGYFVAQGAWELPSSRMAQRPQKNWLKKKKKEREEEERFAPARDVHRCGCSMYLPLLATPTCNPLRLKYWKLRYAFSTMSAESTFPLVGI